VGWKSIDDGVGGHEGACQMRQGSRGFRPVLGGGALLAALAALLVAPLFAASPAEARWNVDPCLNLSQYPPPEGERTVCGNEFQVPSHESDSYPDPRAGTNMSCGRDEKLAGTLLRGTDFNRAHWDFWALRGEWATWTGFGSARYEPYNDGYVKSYSPSIHNWWAGGPWPIRVFINCDEKWHRPAMRSARSHTDNTVESADGDDDVIHGSGEDDVLAGQGGGDELRGARGGDELFGGSGDDATHGGRGDDYQLAGSGDDTSLGGRGDDQLLGGPGDDEAFGGRGSDELFDDEGRDEVRGGRGDDRFSTRDRSADTIRCGKGEDIVVSDRRDRVSADCEHVYRTKAETPKRPPKT
jgi:hypothetical protein